MNYFTLEPECPGVLGSQTAIDTSTHPPIVSKLHVEFDTWHGSDLIESFPCFCVTNDLRNRIDASGLQGYAFDSAKVTVSEIFKELYPECKLPIFYWLRVCGVAGKDDFGLSGEHRLIISEATLHVLGKGKLSECRIKRYC